MGSIIIPVFLLFLISTLMPLSNGIKDEYNKFKMCSSPSSCGRLKDIRYPFWVKETNLGFCGLPEYELLCFNASGDYPHLWIGGLGKSYEVHHINTSTHTVVLAQDHYQTCLALENSHQIYYNETSPFEFGPNVANLTLYYGCSDCNVSSFRSKSFQCQNLGVDSFVYYLDEKDISSNWQSNVTALVSRRALNEFIKNTSRLNLSSVLEAAFEVQYSTVGLGDCPKCQTSGGVCGSTPDLSPAFVCYHSGKRLSLDLKLALGITGGLILIKIALLAFCCCKKLKFYRSNLLSISLSGHTTTSDLENGSLYFGVSLFSYKDLGEATDNFDESRELGNGGFGRVYYGKLRDGREVAVKQLYEKSYKRVAQFMNEVQILTRLRHQNLVSLYGCTSPHCSELILVYEYIRNGTVADHLCGEKPNSVYLSWTTRMRIAIETATALSYLHASDIIHRDVKTNNILLDGNFSVKVADFGLSRLFPNDATHVSTAPQGTPGYIDPDYHHCYQLTAKSDVYSYGVVLIELISSLPAVDMNRQRQEINLSNYAMNRIKRCAFEELVDPQLGFGSDVRIRRMTISVAELAFQCLQHDKEFRPTMGEVLTVLKGIESSHYSEELDTQHKQERRHTKMVSLSPADEEQQDGAISLLSCMYHNHHHHRQQQMHSSSSNSVINQLGSRSTTTSSTSRQDINVFLKTWATH